MLLQWLFAMAQHQILEALLLGYCKIALCCGATCWHTALAHPLCWRWQLLHHANAVNRDDFSNMNLQFLLFSANSCYARLMGRSMTAYAYTHT